MSNDYEAFQGSIDHAVVQVGATSGDQQLVAAVTEKCVRVLGYKLTAKTAVDLVFKDAAGTTANTFSGTISLTDNAVLGEPTTPYPVFQTDPGKGMFLNLSAAKVVGGYLNYRYV